MHLRGLDSSGKSTILKSLLGEDPFDVTPTLGFQIRTTPFFDGRYQVHIWDIGGQTSLRPFWRNYYEKTDGLIWVIDSTSSPQRILESKEMLHQVLTSTSSLGGVSLLIFLNKMDLPHAITPASLEKLLDLSAIKGHQWHVQLCSAILSQNVQQGFNWIVRDIVSRTFSPIVDPKPHHIAGHATSAP